MLDHLNIQNLITQLNLNNIPKHIAIIMDGNGRWATEKNKERYVGHIAGVQSVKTTIKACVKYDIKYLTLYSFSTENWNRPKEEIDSLINLLAEAIKKEYDDLNKNNVKVTIIGDIKKFPDETQKTLIKVVEQTKKNTGLNLVMALNYSSKWEIINAVNLILKDYKNNKFNTKITEQIFEAYLNTKNIPNPELLIRTSGEQRISNFLLYQLAYSELYFTDTYWPDFDEKELLKAILSYQKRERRFGKTSKQINSNQ